MATDNTPPNWVIYSFICLLAIIVEIGHYGKVIFGNSQPDVDVYVTWIKLGKAVVSGTPYINDFSMQTSPPVFLLLTGVFKSTGVFYESFLVGIAISNALSGILIYKYIVSSHSWKAAILSVVLFISAMIPINGVAAAPRPLAMPFLLGALYYYSPVRRGVLLGLAGLTIQSTALAAPALALIGSYRNNSPYQYFSNITISSLVTVIFGYIIVGLIWGVQPMIEGIRITVLGAIGYVDAGTGRFGGPLSYLIFHIPVWALIASRILYISLPIIGYIVENKSEILTYPNTTSNTATIVGISLSPAILLGTAYDYWVPPVTVLSITAGIWITNWLNKR